MKVRVRNQTHLHGMYWNKRRKSQKKRELNDGRRRASTADSGQVRWARQGRIAGEVAESVRSLGGADRAGGQRARHAGLHLGHRRRPRRIPDGAPVAGRFLEERAQKHTPGTKRQWCRLIEYFTQLREKSNKTLKRYNWCRSHPIP
uniref:Uncharacterized protein n=1 Tax=Oryza glumipatula TaxID=40148 RepID=A0A0E0ANM7_9ORYZ